jgi:zinc D-Ala-D-Ala dipeptidase
MKTISPDSLVAMDTYAGEYPLRTEVAYARDDNYLFGERIYRADARLWLHRDLAEIVLEASRICMEMHRCSFVLYDGLRTTDAQEKMLHTQRVKDNPHWVRNEPRLLSPPGMGGHPRGMAIDISLEKNGQLLDMGTPFDFLAENPKPLHNPAHRQHPNLSKEAVFNRSYLAQSMVWAGENLGKKIIPLPEEWWDFRLEKEIYNSFAPLSDEDLPAEMRMV